MDEGELHKRTQEILFKTRDKRTCRFCDRKFKSFAGRKSHETKMHRLELAREVMLRGPLPKWQR